MTTQPLKTDPFKNPKFSPVRPRIFLWGPEGTFKTRTALSCGTKSAYISLERGAQYYRDEFSFREFEPKTFEEILAAVRWLATNKHDYTTVIIDPITCAWDMVQQEYLENKQKSKPNAEITGGDWRKIKPRYNMLLKLLTHIDMNVFVIARSMKNYTDSATTGDMLKVDIHDPEKPSAEGSTAYIMDTVIQTHVDRRGGKNVIKATVRKDRSNKLPQSITEYTADVVRKYFGALVDRESIPLASTIEYDNAIACEACGNDIEAIGPLTATQVAELSNKKFGKKLCTSCGRIAKMALATEK